MTSKAEKRTGIIVFDLDGTLRDCSHRIHHIVRTDGKPKDWRAFYAACHGDAPIPHMIDNLNAFCRAGREVEIWTGHSDEAADATVDWLCDNGVWQCLPAIRFRPAGDHTEDVRLKARWLDEVEAAGGRVDLVFEDRRRVVDMYRARGIACVQVAPGDF